MKMKRSSASPQPKPTGLRSPIPVYPFTGVVGQEEMKLALLLNVIDPGVGGVLVMGHRGTGKSTAVRALADLLPLIQRVRDCPFGCDPVNTANLCADCAALLSTNGKLRSVRASVPVVDLPLGATEDRVCGTINIERALTEGVRAFEPGLLARANRGFLYIDEVNLLEDHLVDLLLDVAVTGRNVVEREGVSVEHPARFVLVGSGNPEEGELRPQLLDRFGLHVEVRTVDDLDQRVEIVERRESFERDPARFRAQSKAEQERLRRRLTTARARFTSVALPRPLLRRIAGLCLQLKIDGHRGELVIARAARALAAFEGRREVLDADVRRVALMALSHRMRRDPLEQLAGNARIEDALDDLFPPQQPEQEQAQKSAETERDDAQPQKTLRGRKSRDGSNQGGDGRSGGVDGAQDNGATRPSPALTNARLPEGAPSQKSTAQHKPKTHTGSSRQQKNVGRSFSNSLRGRYARAVISSVDGSKIALDATLRAAALDVAREGKWRQASRGNDSSQTILGQSSLIRVDKGALRYKRFKRKAGTLFIFAIDTSGSMALNRIGQAKGALSNLLQQSYVRRDRVALLSFRGQRAELLLPPCQSVARARRILDALPVGGATPLSAGISSSIEIARRAAQAGTENIHLLIFTDGRGNVPLSAGAGCDVATRRKVIGEELERLGAALRQTGVTTIVVDTQNRFVSNGEAHTLAQTLGGRHVSLSSSTMNMGSPIL
jgi:magnesium chelatase subunit D